MEFHGFLKDMQNWDSLHKDGGNKSKGRLQKAAESKLTGKVSEDVETISKFPASDAKKTNAKAVSSREHSEHFGYLRNSNAFDLSSSFFTEEKLPDATSEKELGNEYFKQKKFLEAIECYSRSIALTPTSVAFANRAMAYLKVKKFEDAESDCTNALNLDDRYVKAYSRRVTARKELGKLKDAMEDADFAVRLEPNNSEIRKQYSEIKAIVERNCEVNTSSNHVISLENLDKKSTFFITETMNDSRSVDEPEERTTSNLITSVAQEPHGGSHMHESRTSMHNLASRAASRVMANTSKIITTPTSAYQFEVSWRSLSNEPAKQAQLLKTILPSDLPKIFKNALSANMLIDIIRCISTFFRDDNALAVSMLNYLTNVPRFGMIIMCLSAIDRAELLKLWKEVFLNHQVQGDLRQELVRLLPKFCYGQCDPCLLSSKEIDKQMLEEQ